MKNNNENCFKIRSDNDDLLGLRRYNSKNVVDFVPCGHNTLDESNICQKSRM